LFVKKTLKQNNCGKIIIDGFINSAGKAHGLKPIILPQLFCDQMFLSVGRFFIRWGNCFRFTFSKENP
jgi:hypothetical protein